LIDCAVIIVVKVKSLLKSFSQLSAVVKRPQVKILTKQGKLLERIKIILYRPAI